ncbi:GNAT family N-acetyltransferase [Microbacterium sp. NPDC055903]
MDPEGVHGPSPHDAGRRQGHHRAAGSEEGLISLGGEVRLRPLAADDALALRDAYERNRAHLASWDPVREESFYTEQRQAALIDAFLADRESGRAAPFVLSREADGAIVGRVNISNIVRGAFFSADLGYWIDASLAGRGIMRRAVAEICAHAAGELRLHRLQAATLLHNTASQRVLAANGFARIGTAPQYLRIAGRWQDHHLFQRILTPEDAARLRRAGP